MTQMYQLKSAPQTVDNDTLFWGIWLRWRALTIGERFVCANIILIPLWWVAGLYLYMPLLLLLCVAGYELLQYGGLRLKRPNLPVVALLAFGVYQLGKLILNYHVPGRDTFSSTIIIAICPAIWLWYIQSNRIKIRLEVVAWACTISVVQMLVFWLLLQYVLPPNMFWPPRVRTLLGMFKGGSAAGNKNFLLLPYMPRTVLDLEGVNRFSLFFVYPEFLAVVIGFIGLIALDIKNRIWSWSLFLACIFLLFLSATRMVWVAFPLVLCLRYLFVTFGKRWGPTAIFALLAVASFAILSLPPVTDLTVGTVLNSIESVNNVRAGSTEVRMAIYQQTWEAIQENPLWGHMAKGDAVQLFGESRVGTHSVILGNLLYFNGLVGTSIFLVFWISLFAWFYQTRDSRPQTCICLLILYTLVSPTLGLVYEMSISSLLILLCAAMRQPKPSRTANNNGLRKLRQAQFSNFANW